MWIFEAGISGDRDPLNVQNFITRSVEESKAINNLKRRASLFRRWNGDRRRVLHHLAQKLPDARNAIILARLSGRSEAARCEGARALHLWTAGASERRIITLGKFSAHAEQNELLRWLSALQTPPKPADTWRTCGGAALRPLNKNFSGTWQWHATFGCTGIGTCARTESAAKILLRAKKLSRPGLVCQTSHSRGGANHHGQPAVSSYPILK